MPSPQEVLKKMGVKSLKSYKLSYDSSSETLEPIYFWVLDKMNQMCSGGVKKITDNFTSSPGSGHFSELITKGTRMQEEAMKIYGMVNTVIKSILNIIYDLKEFQIRLQNYDDSRSKDKDKAQGGIISLKQIWMDQVDVKKGRGSINMLAQDLNFVTLRDAFFAVNSAKAAEGLDLNDRVKRILKARIEEFNEWLGRSETELRKRFEIEKTYLKTQVNTVKLYSKWVKPYLKAAEELSMQESDDAALVKTFNTIRLQMTLFGKSKINVVEAAQNFELPEEFQKIKMRDYYGCVLVDLKFRGIPQKAGQHYLFGGLADVEFKAYAMNEDELALFSRKMEESDLNDSLKLVEGMTTDSLGQLQEDIDEFLEDKQIKTTREEEKKSESDVNPFSALLGVGKLKETFKFKKKKKELSEVDEEYFKKYGKTKKEIEELEKQIKPDTFAEKQVRKMAGGVGSGVCYALYDVYKKSHGMASTPDKV